MADRYNNQENSGERNQSSNLEGFIASQMEEQQRSSKVEDNLDTEKRDNFVARAVAESRRMNKEIEKSREKSKNLYAEFGQDRMAAWREEHASQVLTPQQSALVEASYQDQK